MLLDNGAAPSMIQKAALVRARPLFVVQAREARDLVAYARNTRRAHTKATFGSPVMVIADYILFLFCVVLDL